MRKSPNYWTYNKCNEVALLCETRKEFLDRFSGAYNKAYKMKWLDDICIHMKSVGNLKKRLVYSYEFENNYVYVGLTGNDKRRNKQHLYVDKLSPVYKHKIKHNLTPIKKILSDGYVDVNDAQDLEKYYLTKYKKNGWQLLNSNKTGGLGGNTLIWDKKMCKKVALLCESRKEFSIKFSSAYISSRKNEWLDEICTHMKRTRKPQRYWNYETCRKVAKYCNSRFEFSRKWSGAYYVARKNNWLDDFFGKK